MPYLKRTTILTSILSCIPMIAWACTGIELTAKDHDSINGRTLEFAVPLNFQALYIPRNINFVGTLPDGSEGLHYVSKYAVIGSNTYGASEILDGMNEKGLTVADFYFPGYAQYAQVTSKNKNQALSPTQFSNWLLTQYATTEEVKKGLNSASIVATIPKGWPVLPPLHYIVYDASGKSIVIEPINGKLKIYDNPIGVFTNSPTFSWHLTNLANYINLSPINASPILVNGLTLQQLGQGSGLRGLPGDFTSPSRFVRAAVFATTAVTPKDGHAGVLEVFHILNQFDIPTGSIREDRSNKAPLIDYTMATTVKDPSQLKYYFRTYEDQSIREIDLKKFNWNSKNLEVINMQDHQPIADVTLTAKTVDPNAPKNLKINN